MPKNTTEEEEELDPDFAGWCFSSTSEDGQPLMTHLLYKVCDKDGNKFNLALDMLKSAFNAGRAAAGKSRGPI